MILVLSACSVKESETTALKKEDDKFEKLAEEKNKEFDLESIELTTYSEEIGLKLI